MSHIIYRIENPKTGVGLWYAESGATTNLIKRLDNAKARDLPMPYDPAVYAAEGKAWFSGCDCLPDMREWFHWKDVVELMGLGYGLFKFEVAEFRRISGHVIFTRDSILDTAICEPTILRAA